MSIAEAERTLSLSGMYVEIVPDCLDGHSRVLDYPPEPNVGTRGQGSHSASRPRAIHS